MPRPPPVVPFIQTGNPEMDRLQRFVQQALPGKQDVWSPAKLINGWVNLDAPSPRTGFYRDSVGLVHVRIYVKSGTVGSAFFNLPFSYRPLSDLNPILVWSSGTGAQPLTIKANGDVGFIGAGNTSIVGEAIFDTR